MKLYRELWMLTCLTMPITQWACMGIWTGGDGNWNDSTHWSGCLVGEYPGKTNPFDLALLNPPSSHITLNTNPQPLYSLLINNGGTYTVQQGGDFTLRFQNGGMIQIGGADAAELFLEVPIDLSGPPPTNPGSFSFHTLSGPITIKQAVTHTGGDYKIIYGGTGFNSHFLMNYDNAVGLDAGSVLSLNPTPGDHGIFVNFSINSTSKVFANILEVKRSLEAPYDLANENQAEVTSGTGADFQAGLVVLHPTQGKPVIFFIENGGHVTGEGSRGSILRTGGIIGSGVISIENFGVIESGALGSCVEVIGVSELTPSSIWEIDNSNRVTGPESVGSALRLQVPLTMTGGRIRLQNVGDVNDFGIGSLLTSTIDLMHMGGEIIVENWGTVRKGQGSLIFPISLQTTQGTIDVVNYGDVSEKGNGAYVLPVGSAPLILSGGTWVCRSQYNDESHLLSKGH